MNITALFLSVITFISSFFWGMFYPEYAKNSEKVADIPGLSTDFVPQGSTYLADEDIYICCGYMDNDEPSRLYMIKDSEEKMVLLKREDGSDYGGHAGGITAAGEYVYISNQHKFFVLKKSDLIEASDGCSAAFIGHIDVPCNASYCSYSGEYIFIGEYHADGYETDESHALKTPDGSSYAALTFGYKINPDAEFGIESEAPAVAFSTCDKVQGFAAENGKAVLSVSGGTMSSKLRIYDIKGDSDGEFDLGGVKIPLYYLDSGRHTEDMTIPRMSEDIEFVDGKILIAYEAAAKKFVSGILPFSEKRMMLVSV